MLENVNRIYTWIEKSRKEEDYFDKFVYGFFALNALYSDYYDESEKEAIKTLVDEDYASIKEDLLKIFDLSEFEYFCNRDPIKNMRYDPAKGIGYPDTKYYVEKIREKSPRKSTKAMLMILYQIRCNLFHGDKSFNVASDQEVMKNASELLLRYNEAFIKKYGPL
ncbi:MAG: hypothetical protein K5776_08325 [Lachnospiraceae bacterium]|nr:hypothetical protein [Lachnospiraceae bacterium]